MSKMRVAIVDANKLLMSPLTVRWLMSRAGNSLGDKVDMWGANPRPHKIM